MKTKKEKKTSALKNNAYMLKLVWQVYPKRIICNAIYFALDYFTWIFSSVIFLKYIFESLSESTKFKDVLFFLTIALLIYFVSCFYKTWYEKRFLPISDDIIYGELTKIMYDKSSDVDLSCFENTDFYNKYTLALSETKERFKSVLDILFKIIFASCAASFVIYTMFTIDKFVALFSIFPFIGTFVFAKITNKYVYERAVEQNPYYRRKDYVSRIIYLSQYAKEIRLTSVFKVLKKIYNEGFDGIISLFKKRHTKKIVILSYLQSMCNYMFMFQGVFLYSAYRAIVSQTMTLAQFAILSSTMVSATWTLIDLSSSLGKTIESGLYIENLKTFLSHVPKIPESSDGLSPDRDISSIEFRNVSFKYDDESEYILTNLSFKVAAKEKLIIVGQNGAGKSTVIKLLMRFYDPCDGNIFVNGIDIKEYNLKQYRAVFGVAFQDYQLFSMSVLENVIMHDEKEKDREHAFNALSASGIIKKINTLPKSIDTTLTREFDDDGAVLSGGESQKIAISRAFFKNSGICVFDEPSSALDPVAENYLYKNMVDYTKDKIIFFISHRLSSAIFSDNVLMLENGRIVEYGSHKKLLNDKKGYYEMFNMQAKKYFDDIDWSSTEMGGYSNE